MQLVKKLILAPVFLIIFGLLVYQLNPFLTSYEVIFALSWSTLTQLILLSSLILIASLTFNLFATFAQDWKIIVPIGVIATLLPLIIISQAIGLILTVGTLITLLLTYLTLENKLKTYLTFEPNSLLGSSIRHMATLLVIIISLSYFLSINRVIQQEGFQIPDSLIDTTLKIAAPAQSETTDQPKPVVQPQLTQDFIKQTVKDQLQTLLKPHLGFIPAALAVILFLTLTSIVSLLGLLIYPVLWMIFYILEKTGFIQFIVEQRPVKKMVI